MGKENKARKVVFRVMWLESEVELEAEVAEARSPLGSLPPEASSPLGSLPPEASFPQGSLGKRKKPTRVVGFILHCTAR